jgi:enoyl-CoA hydratase/carnithine racemase
MTETLEIHLSGAVAWLTLNRPEAQNALNRQMIGELLGFFTDIREDRRIRAVVIGAAGKVFCAGGDLKDLQARPDMTWEEKIALTAQFDPLLKAMNESPQVTIARIQGAVMGGGMGLVCVSDIAIASSEAMFGLPEVRIGVAPALISPYIIQRIGLTRTRQWMLTGRRFSAEEALAAGLIHEICPPDKLDSHIENTVHDILQCAPYALAETKQLIFQVMDRRTEETLSYRAELITRLRESAEGQEGMRAFLERRKPSWAEG